MIAMQKSAAELLRELTLQEKAALCSGADFWYLKGIERLDIPKVMVTDGPHGLRKQPESSDHLGLNVSIPATCFPTASGLAASWNRNLVREVGVALGRECLAQDVSAILGPGVNLKRHPLGGRNFEYFSEDPYLTGEMGIAWVEGVQSQGVGTSLKHFAVNNHEHARMAVDIIVDERTLREIYLRGFEAVVKRAQPWTVMTAYNKLGGHFLSEHSELITDILRNEWKFEGLTVTDWGATSDRVKAINAGQDLEMPTSGDFNTTKILKAIEDGALSKAALDRAVERILEFIQKSRPDLHTPMQVSLDDHHDLARRAAEEACVLLKNDGILPLSKSSNLKIAVLGGLASNTRYQGAGSSQINPYKLEQPLDALIAAFGEQNIIYEPGYSLSEPLNEIDRDAAIRVCAESDIIIFFAGLTPDYESEGFDRKHMRLPPQQLELIEALSPYCDKLVIVLQNGSPVELPFADHVAAILEAYLGGQAGASAIARILSGDVNPSGKLAETFPLSEQDVPSDKWFPGDTRSSEYREAIWVGYRYFDTTDSSVLYSFGHGLSYTVFDYDNLQLEQRGGADVSVSFTVSNSGDVAGAEIAQCYVGQLNSSVPRPRKDLRAFEKIFLAPGETKTIRFDLSDRDFAFWDVESSTWKVETDTYQICIGASVADVRLNKSIETSAKPMAVRREGIESYFAGAVHQITADEFEMLLGHSIPEPVPVKPFHVNSLISETTSTAIGRMLAKNVNKQIRQIFIGEGEESPTKELLAEAVANEMPLRNLVLLSNGALSFKTLYRLIHMMNGHYFKAALGTKVDAF